MKHLKLMRLSTKMLPQNQIDIKLKCCLGILFFLTLIYLFFYTNGVPFFWDDHEFHSFYANQSYLSLIKTGLSEIGMTSYTLRTGFGLFFKILLDLFGYDPQIMRLAVSIIFAMTSTMFAYLCLRYIHNRFSVLLIPLFVIFTFPIYIHLLTHDYWFLSNFFIIMAIMLFLSDYHKLKTSILKQIGIFFLCFVSFRTYSPSLMIFGLLFLFILFTSPANLKRYCFLLVSIFMVGFPFIAFFQNTAGPVSSLFSSLDYKPLKGVILNPESLDFIISPIPNFNDLYYLPYVSIISFFGFWLLVITLFLWGLYLFNKFKPLKIFNTEVTFSNKRILIFTFIWFICESSIWLILPEHAIRYASGGLMPFAMLCGILLFNTKNVLKVPYKRLFSMMIILIICLTVLTNLAYITLFRASWGSAFVAYEKVTPYLESVRDQNSTIIYYATSAAMEYIPLTEYTKRKCEVDIESYRTYRKEGDPLKFSEDEIAILKKEFNEVYILKRITSFTMQQFPEIDFSMYKNLRLIKIFDGKEDVLFDNLFSYFVKKFKIEYQPNKVYIYKTF